MSKVMQKMMEDAARQAMEITAKIFGMETETVAMIMKVGLPMQMKFVSENPDMVKQMYKEAFVMMPEQVQAFYRDLGQDLAKDEEVLDQMVEDYKAFMGASAEAINTVVAEELEGVSEADVEKVMAAMQPEAKAAVKEEAEAAGVEDEKSFGGWLRAEGEAI